MKQPGGTPESCGCKNGNEGMRKLVEATRAAGFKWGSYSNMAGCQVAACDIPALNSSKNDAFIKEDAEMYLGECVHKQSSCVFACVLRDCLCFQVGQ